MELIRKSRNALKHLLFRISNQSNNSQSEEDYYSWFFTKNEYWNQPTPNFDEELRWKGILSMINSIEYSKATRIKILDLGCGRGWMTHLLSEHGDVQGIEPVKQVAEYGKKLFPELAIEAGDSDYLIKKGFQNTFDLIVSSEVIEHVENKKKRDFANNLDKLLKKSGWVIITTPRREVLKLYCNYVKPAQPIEDWMTESEVSDLFTSNGFEIVDKSTLSKEVNGSPIKLEVYQLWLFRKK